MNRKDAAAIYLTIQLASQCAPLLTGMKESNLLIVERHKLAEIRLLLNESELKAKFLYQCQGKSAFLIYHENRLMNMLKTKDRKEFLEKEGYDTKNLNHMVKMLMRRCNGYWSGQAVFPHELGIFLGYPVYDVLGFIQNKGRNSLYSGYWKVYDNVKWAKQVFNEYERAKQLVKAHIKNGGSLDFFFSEDWRNTLSLEYIASVAG